MSTVKSIIKVYADLVRHGRKTIEEVPDNIREEVRKLLAE